MTPEERARFCASLFLDPAKVSSEKRARVEREIAVSIREAVKAEREACREALAFAASCIKSGEPWTTECARIIDGALAKAKRPA